MINVLLTGAGFTANFGAPLARNIYEKIYNYKEIQESIVLAARFKDKKNINASNYEKIYQDIIYSKSFSLTDKQILRDAIYKVLTEEIDFYCRTPMVKIGSCGKSSIELLQYLLIKFFNTNEKSVFFSLNQDLFIERQCYALSSDYKIYSPDHVKRILRDWGIETSNPICFKRLGVHHCKIGVGEKYDKQYDIKIDSVSVDNAKKEFAEWNKSNSTNCLYIKLHGSQDFIDNDGNRLLITGTQKKSQISSEALISLYNKILDTILSEKSCRIIIIGYSFNDDHINQSIIKSLKNDKSMIYIIDKMNLNNFLEDLIKKPKFQSNKIVDQLKDKLNGYLSHGLTADDLKNGMFTTFLPDFDSKQNI